MHLFFKNSFKPPFPQNFSLAYFGMGCFWGAEKLFWKTKGVYTTAVGYAGGDHQQPSYELVCSGTTNHAEVVMVVYNSEEILLKTLLNTFFLSHDPTQLNRQGNDIGTQYRSIILLEKEDEIVEAKRILNYTQDIFTKNNLGLISTEVKQIKLFFYAEEYHQQYLIRNPNGYCNLKKININLNF